MKVAFKILKSRGASVEEMAELVTQLEEKEAQAKERLAEIHQKVIDAHKANLLGHIEKGQIKTSQGQEAEVRNEIEALAEIIKEEKTKLLNRLKQGRTQRIGEFEKKIKDLRSRKKELEKEKVSAFAQLDILIEMISGMNPLEGSTRFEIENRQFFRDEIARFRKVLNPGGDSSLKAQRNKIDADLIQLHNQKITEADVERLLDRPPVSN